MDPRDTDLRQEIVQLKISSAESKGHRAIRFWKRVAMSLMYASALVMAGGTALWYEYAQTRPQTAQPGEGRIYGLNTHGHVVYLTWAESVRLHGLGLLAGVCFVGGFAIYTMLKRRGYEE
jgi:hypothetical protein